MAPVSSGPVGRARLHLSSGFSSARQSAGQEPSQAVGGGKRRQSDRKAALVELDWVRGQTTSALAAQTPLARPQLAPYDTSPRTTPNAVLLPGRLHHQPPNSPAPTAASVSRASWRCCSMSRSDQASSHSAALCTVESSLASITSSTCENVLPCSIMASTCSWCWSKLGGALPVMAAPPFLGPAATALSVQLAVPLGERLPYHRLRAHRHSGPRNLPTKRPPTLPPARSRL